VRSKLKRNKLVGAASRKKRRGCSAWQNSVGKRRSDVPDLSVKGSLRLSVRG
jgi:hypothetical protein